MNDSSRFQFGDLIYIRATGSQTPLVVVGVRLAQSGDEEATILAVYEGSNHIQEFPLSEVSPLHEGHRECIRLLWDGDDFTPMIIGSEEDEVDDD